MYTGPTHDDITYESIASAFGLEMKVDQMTYEYIEKQIKKGGKEMTKHHARLATFPSPASLLRERKEIVIPIVVVNTNVYILPGIPHLFKLLMDSLQMKLEGLSGTTRFYRREIATSQSEVVIADVLSVAQTKANLFGIKIGSYPMWGTVDEDVRVVVNVSGKDELKVNEMSDMITGEIQGWPYDPKEKKKSRL